MRVFWRNAPLTAAEEKLMKSVIDAHYRSSFRESGSTVVMLNALIGSGDFFNAISAALLTFGNLHGPIQKTMSLLTEDNIKATVQDILRSGLIVPGWGGSFQGEDDDPLWREVEAQSRPMAPSLWTKVDLITDTLKTNGKNICPNPSTHTAVASIILGIPARISGYLLLAGRLDGWSELAAKQDFKCVAGFTKKAEA
jgi:citrate synthase